MGLMGLCQLIWYSIQISLRSTIKLSFSPKATVSTELCRDPPFPPKRRHPKIGLRVHRNYSSKNSNDCRLIHARSQSWGTQLRLHESWLRPPINQIGPNSSHILPTPMKIHFAPPYHIRPFP